MAKKQKERFISLSAVLVYNLIDVLENSKINKRLDAIERMLVIKYIKLLRKELTTAQRGKIDLPGYVVGWILQFFALIMNQKENIKIILEAVTKK